MTCRDAFQDAFLELVRIALQDGFPQARDALDEVKALGASSLFVLRSVVRLAEGHGTFEAQSAWSAWAPQAASLLLGFGGETTSAEVYFKKLTRLPEGSTLSGLKLLKRAFEAWEVKHVEQLSPKFSELLAERLLAATEAEALAALALGGLPGLLSVEQSGQLLRWDDGQRDEAVELMATGLAKEAQVMLVQRRQQQRRLRAAAKAVARLKLQEQFPDVDFQWKKQALEAAIRKGRREAMVGLSCEEPRLHARCVQGLLECDEVELAADLAWGWRLTVEVAAARLTAARQAREASCLCLPADVSVDLVDNQASLGRLASLASLAADAAVGFDLECNCRGEPTLLQLATLREVFLVDLLCELPLAEVLDPLWAAPMVKVSFGGDDVGKLRRWGLRLDGATVDLKDLEAQRREGPLKEGKRKSMHGLSLSSVAEKYLGKPLDKTFQVGDWSPRPLSAVRRHYAALDAWVPVKVYHLMMAPGGGYLT